MMNKAYIGGTFDPPHKGHDRLIERVEKLGFKPIVVVNSDSFVREYKGREPFMGENERKSYFKGEVHIVDKNAQRELIKTIKPDVIVIGTDWLRPEILNQLGIDENFIDKHNIGLLFFSRTKGISSTELRNDNDS